MAARQIASHNDYVKLEALVESGKSVYEAAAQIGLPLGAFKTAKGDREWYDQIAAKVETVRAAIVDHRMDELALTTENASIVNKWASANHEAYREKQEINVSGEIGVNHPDLIAAFDNFVAQLAELAGRRDPAVAAGEPAGEVTALPAISVAVQRPTGSTTPGG